MSTWTTASYRPDAIRAVARYLPKSEWASNFVLSLADWDVEPVGGHHLPPHLEEGPFAPQLHANPDVLDALLPPYKHQPSNSFKLAIDAYDNAYSGLDAVYRLAAIARATNQQDAKKGCASLPHDQRRKFEEDREHSVSAFRVLLAAGSHTGQDIAPREAQLAAVLEGGFHQAKQTIRGLIQTATSANTRAHRNQVADAELMDEPQPFCGRIAVGGLRHWNVLKRPGLTILAQGEIGSVYVLVGNDIERLERLLQGEAYVLAAACLRVDSAAARTQVVRLRQVFDFIFKRAAELNKREQPLLARAFNVAHYCWLAKASESLDPRPELEQAAKWVTERLYRVAPIGKLLGLFAGQPLKEALELSLVYKVLPPADYDYFGAAARQEEKSFDPGDFKVPPCEGDDWEGILLYHRWLMLYAFYKAHGRCPGVLRKAAPGDDAEDVYEDVEVMAGASDSESGDEVGLCSDSAAGSGSEDSDGMASDSGSEVKRERASKRVGRKYGKPVYQGAPSWEVRYPNVHPDSIPVGEMMKIDFNGDFVYQKRADDVLDLVKDKGICPAQHHDLRHAGDRAKLPLSEKNQLGDVLTRAKQINTTEMDFDSVMLDVEADDKAESKKPNSRWFYKAGTDARILQSEYEDSVGKYAVKAPGVMIGLDLEQRMKTLAFVREAGNALGPDETVSWSFDIKGFSANLKVDVHKALDAQWAEAFGEPGLVNAHKLFTEGKVIYLKPGIRHEFEKLCVDFEGFAGRKLTLFHAAVMGYVIHLLRVEGVITAKGRFAAFIDDGLLRLNIPRDGFDERVARASEVIERVYMAGSMAISWDKTLVSKLLQTFLGDVTAAGRTINPGLKAVTRISNRGTAAIPSLLDDLETLTATCSGAIKAGEHIVPVVGLYAALLTDLLRKWGHAEPTPTVNAVIAMLFPIGLGGLGIPNPLAMAGSVASNGLQEALGNLQMVGIRMPGVRSHINETLNTHLRNVRVSDTARLQGGLGVKSHVPSLRSDRLQRAVLDGLPKVVKEPNLKRLLTVDTGKGSAFTEAQLDAGARIPLELRAALYASSPEHYVKRIATKFTTERTARLVVGARRLKRIREANRNEAARVVHYINTSQIRARH